MTDPEDRSPDTVAGTAPEDHERVSASIEAGGDAGERRRAADEVTVRVTRIRALSDRLIEAERQLRESQRQLDRASADLARLRGRRTVRAVLKVTSLARRLPSRRAVATSKGQTLDVRGVTERVTSTPQEFRDRFLRRVVDPSGAPAPLRVAIAVAAGSSQAGDASTDAGAMAASLSASGRTVTIARSDEAVAGGALGQADVVVSHSDELDIRSLPDGTVTIAWVDGSTDGWLGRAWFDEYDIVITRSPDAATTIDTRSVQRSILAATAVDPGAAVSHALEDWARAPRIDIAIGPQDWESAPRWGDLYFGRAVQRALQGRGYPTRIRLRSAWEAPAAGRADAAIHVFGRVERPTFPGQLSILWVISHPDLVTDAMIGRYDPIFVASDRFAAELAARTGREVRPLHQATDPDRFQPVAGGPEHELLFVANSRGVHRPIIDELTPTARDLAVYGQGWSLALLDPRHLRGEHVANDQLAAYYAAAGIVLNDHWADMAEHGFLSNRLYDAAASGAFVISDEVPGLETEFDGGIVAYADGPGLRELVDRYLADPAGRVEHARRARAAVLAAHTFEHRVDEILRVVGTRLAGPPVPMPREIAPGPNLTAR